MDVGSSLWGYSYNGNGDLNQVMGVSSGIVEASSETNKGP